VPDNGRPKKKLRRSSGGHLSAKHFLKRSVISWRDIMSCWEITLSELVIAVQPRPNPQPQSELK
jgi:hypothetical protein